MYTDKTYLSAAALGGHPFEALEKSSRSSEMQCREHEKKMFFVRSLPSTDVLG